MTCDVEHLFQCLFAVCISSLVKCPNLQLIFRLGSAYIYIYISLEDSFMDLSLFFLCILWVRRLQTGLVVSFHHQWRLPLAPLAIQLWLRNLLGCKRACDLHICSSFTCCGSAGLVKNWFLLLLPYSVIRGEKLLLLIWLHRWFFSCQIWCMKNLQNLPFPWLLPSCLLLLPAVNISQVQPMYLLIFTPSYNKSLEVLVYKTNEKRESYWCMG